MREKIRFAFLILMGVAGTALFLFSILGSDVLVMNPKGIIGVEERDLMVTTTLLMCVIVIPVFIMMAVITWRYRASNKKATYKPMWAHSWLAETLWWGLPCVIIVILSVMTWKSCHSLDPFQPLVSDKKPVTIQVIALQWKWLFIYPEHNIATVNYIQFPEKVPINFEIAAEAPMNSFWIPQLGGQIYAMEGMKTTLHLIADHVGDYWGVSANISGTGFSGMKFAAKATTQEEFDEWILSVQKSEEGLNRDKYGELVKPSEYDPPAFYTLEDPKLFTWVVMKFMTHCSGGH
jgi:cytochrome o ubiquinol oxidase subunit 2